MEFYYHTALMSLSVKEVTFKSQLFLNKDVLYLISFILKII